jgi:hypothetical protein
MLLEGLHALGVFAFNQASNVCSAGFRERENSRLRAAQYMSLKSRLNWNMLPRSSAPGKPKPR